MIKLETDKLILRMFTPDDLDALDCIFSKPSVMKYLGLHGEPMSRDETETALLSMIKHWERYGYGRLAVISKNDQKLIGCAGLRSFDGIAELVFLIDEHYWGKGLATEIATGCLNYGFEKHNFEKIIAFARPQNLASRKVIEKVGMHFVKQKVVFGVFVVQYELSRENYFYNLSSMKS
jgi:ribosomal-protein-alanine N-acetyltransferase